jgi:H+/Cl- antiporter ClcA
MLISLLVPVLALACGGVWVRQGGASTEDASMLLWLALLVPFLLLAAGMWAVWRTAREDARRDE